MKKKGGFPLSVLLLILLPLFPLVIAFVVYLVDAARDGLDLYELLDTLYNSLRIYSMGLVNRGQGRMFVGWEGMSRLLLEIARWGAIAVVAVAAVKLLTSALQRLFVSLVAMSPYSFALHGDDAPVSRLKRELGVRGIRANVPEKYRAANHILVFRSAKNLYAFLDDHYEKLIQRKNAHVFICMSETIHSAQIDRHVVISDMTKNCARLYWKRLPLKPEERHVVLVGLGRYGSQLLTQALQVNVFLKEREVVYHVFGSSGEYMARHPQLEQVAAINRTEPGRDSVFFHHEPWYEAQDVLRCADRVILCEDQEEDNFPVMDYLLEQRVNSCVHVRVHSAGVLRALWQREPGAQSGVIPFGMDEELYRIDQVTNASLNARGRLAHAYYYRSYGEGCGKAERCLQHGDGKKKLGKCITCPEFDRDWDALSAYKRSSSLAQDDHADVKIRELLGREIENPGLAADEAYEVYERLCEEEKRRWWDLEHRRWMRFLYMHGWKYAPVRSDEKLEHPLLVPFDELPDEEQRKDANAYEILGEMSEYMAYRKEMIDQI